MVRVRPEQFVVDEAQPFEGDRLDRRRRVEALCRLIARTESAAVVAVNGSFGSGKSVFLKMCAAHLRGQGVAVAEFNAWQQSHTHATGRPRLSPDRRRNSRSAAAGDSGQPHMAVGTSSHKGRRQQGGLPGSRGCPEVRGVEADRASEERSSVKRWPSWSGNTTAGSWCSSTSSTGACRSVRWSCWTLPGTSSTCLAS